jgi:hypothetical protein
MNHYNLEKLIKVEVNEERKSIHYFYRKEKKLLGFILRKEGFYYEFLRTSYVGVNLPDEYKYKFVDGVVYVKKQVILHYQNGFNKAYYFDTDEMQNEFVSKLTSVGSWLSN